MKNKKTKEITITPRLNQDMELKIIEASRIIKNLLMCDEEMANKSNVIRILVEHGYHRLIERLDKR